MTDRRYLAYCSVKNGDYRAEFFGENRLFDVALNERANTAAVKDRPEWLFSEPGHKWFDVAENLPKITQSYAYYAFLDADLEISTDGLNRLFQIGEALQLQLFQPALTRDSYYSHPHVLQNEECWVRSSQFIEVMAPFFRSDALAACAWTFRESRSGWGLDFLWGRILCYQGMAIIDAVPVRHCNPVNSMDWKYEDGMSPLDELRAIRRKFGV